MRFCIISIGILYICTAVWTFANKGVAFIALAFILGLVMIIQGLFSLFAYFNKCKGKTHLSYILADGIIALILGVAVISNRLVTDVEVPLLFGLWIIFSGTKRISTSFNIGRRRVGMRKYVFFLGILDILFGIGMLFNSVILAVPNIALVAFCFLVQGINVIAAGIEMPKPAAFYNRKKEHIKNESVKLDKKKEKPAKAKTRSEKFAEKSAKDVLAMAEARAMEEAKMLKMLESVRDEEIKEPIEAETADAEAAAIGAEVDTNDVVDENHEI